MKEVALAISELENGRNFTRKGRDRGSTSVYLMECSSLRRVTDDAYATGGNVTKGNGETSKEPVVEK